MKKQIIFSFAFLITSCIFPAALPSLALSYSNPNEQSESFVTPTTVFFASTGAAAIVTHATEKFF